MRGLCGAFQTGTALCYVSPPTRRPMRNPEERIDAAVLDRNFVRLGLVPFVAIPIHLGHIAFFLRGLAAPGTAEHAWGVGIMLAHTALLLFSLSLGLLAWMRRRWRWPDGRAAWFVVDLVAIIVMMAGVGVAVLDQLVTPSVTPFLVASTLVAVVPLLRPLRAIVLFASGYAGFYSLLSWTQSDPMILLSNRVNGITIVGIGFVLSVFLWRRTRAALEQSFVIEAQQAELADRHAVLVRKSAELRELNATKDKLFSIVAHDLRSPFQSILGLSDILVDEAYTAPPEALGAHARSVRDAAARTLELLDNLLHWAHVQQGGLTLAPRRGELGEVFGAVLPLVRSAAERKRIEIRRELPDGLAIITDTDLLQSVLRNLLSNAIKFTPAGGWVHLSARRVDEFVRIAIADGGIGIRPETLAGLFGDGAGVSRPGTADEAGTGLGLVLCKDFVERLGGRIEVASEVGKGSTFSVILPGETEPVASVAAGV